MTEDEAKTRWCPFARERAAQGMPDGGGNRTPYGSADDGPVEDDYIREQAMAFPRIGSACMAWRWDGIEVLQLTPDETPKGHGWIAGEMWKDGRYRRWERRDPDGYCGLAGKP